MCMKKIKKIINQCIIKQTKIMQAIKGRKSTSKSHKTYKNIVYWPFYVVFLFVNEKKIQQNRKILLQ